MGASDEFLERADVKDALREIADADDGPEGDRGDVSDRLRERGLDVPAGMTLTMIRTAEESDVGPLKHLCPDGSDARPVNCRPHPTGNYPICDWICS
jgi:hypothetical protein